MASKAQIVFDCADPAGLNPIETGASERGNVLKAGSEPANANVTSGCQRTWQELDKRSHQWR